VVFDSLYLLVDLLIIYFVEILEKCVDLMIGLPDFHIVYFDIVSLILIDFDPIDLDSSIVEFD